MKEGFKGFTYVEKNFSTEISSVWREFGELFVQRPVEDILGLKTRVVVPVPAVVSL